MEDRDELTNLRAVFLNAKIIVCRLVASVATMQERLRVRETGLRQQEFVERSAVLDVGLSRAAIEDFTLQNESRNVTEVAREMLERANWLKSRQPRSR